MYLYIEMNQQAIVNSIAWGEISISLLTELPSLNKKNIIIIIIIWYYSILYVSVSVSAIWLPPSSYWKLCNFDFCAACPTNSEAKI